MVEGRWGGGEVHFMFMTELNCDLFLFFYFIKILYNSVFSVV